MLEVQISFSVGLEKLTSVCFESSDKGIFLLVLVAMPIDCAHHTVGHVLSAHAHNWPGKDHQQIQCSSYIISFSDADTRHAWGMCSIEL